MAPPKPQSPINTAAWLTAAKARPLAIKSAPYTSPKANEIVVKNAAIAINPSDWLKQDLGNMLYSWVKYPFVLGTDAAGTVVELGSSVTRFKIGDRVVGHAVGIDQKINSSAEGTFQTYTILRAEMTSPIPDSLSFESASVIPLGASTAACGLFEKDQLALQAPSIPPKPTGKTLLIWGGSTSVGLNAIQLAVAAGYEVFATASPKNFAYLKSLGASRVFDYNSPTVISDLKAAFKGKKTAGALSMGAGAADACLDILGHCEGDKFIAMATYPMPSPLPESFVMLKTIYSFVSWNIARFFKSKIRGVRSKFIFGSTLAFNGVGKMVYEDFLPYALADGSFVAAPEPVVVGKGLEFVQVGLDLQKKGLSAKKVVVSL
jgi:NADPH:quinone reductase-like Zn-dependent oxidoreductase